MSHAAHNERQLQQLTAYVTVWTLVLMACDRFLAVVFPVESLTLRSSRNTVHALLALWTVVALGSAVVAFDYHVVEYTFCGENRSSCVYIYSQPPNLDRARVRLCGVAVDFVL